jgi:predicted DNA-binding transcriptional regulator YafY
MAINKNAFIRYKVLDGCFRNPGKKYFMADLIAACDQVMLEQNPNSDGISRRQIFEDIAFMCSEAGWSIPLDKMRDDRKVYYQYNDLDFSINKMPLNELEVNQLQSAIQILSQFSGMPQFEWIRELVPKLKQGLSAPETAANIIEFDTNPYLRGIEYLGDLYNAIFYKKVLRIAYQPFEHETPFELTLHPYHLKQYNNRWFLYGFNPYNQKYDWSLALDRMTGFKEISEPYVQNDQIDWPEYFEDMIGVSKPDGATVEKIEIHFYGKTGKYMASKPIHGSQKSKWLDENTLEIKLDIIINYEFERFLLSYADVFRILKPKRLANTIKQKLINALKLLSP